MTKFSIKQDILHDFEKSVNKEFIITNGIGGYASSTVIGCNNRKYHGLLVASNPSTLERKVTLANLDETITIGNEDFNLSTHQYLNKINPQGYNYLEEFNFDLFPKFTYRVKNAKIEKEIFMIHGENTTFISYKISCSEKITFKISPLITYRVFHEIKSKKKLLNNNISIGTSSVTLKDFDKGMLLYISGRKVKFKASKSWYKKIYYKNEHLRGYDCIEDLICPGYFYIKGRGNIQFSIYATDRKKNFSTVKVERTRQAKRLSQIIKRARPKDAFEKILVKTADSFIIERKENNKSFNSIIAGYHWFDESGRDAMISLSGLTLSTRRYQLAQSILANFAQRISRWMLPTTYPDKSSKIQCNTVDTSLWFINALYSYYEETKDKKFIKQMLPKVKEIIKYYINGTRFGTKMDKDYLIFIGKYGMQGGWFDIKVKDQTINSRQGKLVEIQALWYNALKITEEFCRLFKENHKDYLELAENVKLSFRETFICSEGGSLYDYIYKEYEDKSLRPNQLSVLSLPYTMLGDSNFKEIVKLIVILVNRRLRTPYGLRSLSSDHPGYIGVCEGNIYQREKAYYQGTVWPYMLGAFIDSYLRIKCNKLTKKIAKEMLLGLFEHLNDAGIGTISEIFDGNEPYNPKGCISQAWNVAEILRIKKKYKL